MKTIPVKGTSGYALDNVINPLILDLLDWLAPEPRPYAEVMDVWRTSCPRLPVWEEAVARGLVVRRREADTGPVVALTAVGRQVVEAGAQRA